MKYLKVYVDFVRDMELLSDAERGRLFVAMLAYASDKTEPGLKGNEKYLWATAKKTIDSQRKSYDNKVAGAAAARSALSDIKSNKSD